MNGYHNSNTKQRFAGFEDVVIIKRSNDDEIIPMQIYYANKVEIKYPPGLCGAYTQTYSIITYTADLPETNNGIVAASEFSPFGRSIIGRSVGEKFNVKLPEGNIEEYTIISIIDKNRVKTHSA